VRVNSTALVLSLGRRHVERLDLPLDGAAHSGIP
jgi:hypothetical protein